MGTKNNPGIYDCYANAEPDEPIFILLGRDSHAPAAVLKWADDREILVEAGLKPTSDRAMVIDARECAQAMIAYSIKKMTDREITERTLERGKMSVSLDDQVKCVRRELALMRHTYSHFVSRGTVTRKAATERLATMEAALKTLKEIRDHGPQTP